MAEGEEGLIPRSLAQVTESLEPLTIPQGVGEEQVGCWWIQGWIC